MAPIKKRTTARAKIAAKNRPVSHAPPSGTDSGLEASASRGAGFGDDDETSASFSSFANSKKDKRTMKHSAFVSKIEKSNKKALKRRRPNKQLKTQLEGLVDALPDIEAQNDDEGNGSDDDWEGMSEDDDAAAGPAASKSDGQDMLGALAGMVNIRKSIKKSNTAKAEGDGKMKMKTLKSRPGAAKRKAMLEGREMERFQKNLAQMSQPGAGAQAQVSSAPAAASANATAATGGATADRWAALRGFIGQTMERNPNFGKAA